MSDPQDPYETIDQVTRDREIALRQLAEARQALRECPDHTPADAEENCSACRRYARAENLAAIALGTPETPKGEST